MKEGGREGRVTSQNRFLHAESHNIDHAHVRGDLVSFLQMNDVTGYQLISSNLGEGRGGREGGLMPQKLHNPLFLQPHNTNLTLLRPDLPPSLPSLPRQ